MINGKDTLDDKAWAKISPALRPRLGKEDTYESIRAIVLLVRRQFAPSVPANNRRADRQTTIQATRTAGLLAIPEIDAILRMYGGRRLDTCPSVLGALTVETGSLGLLALAKSDYVQSITEDLPLKENS